MQISVYAPSSRKETAIESEQNLNCFVQVASRYVVETVR